MCDKNGQWFFVRDNLEETDSKSASGNVSSSPDVILGDKSRIDDYIKNYSKDVSEDIHYGQSNYIFLRAKNLGKDLENGDAVAYLTTENNLCDPPAWQRLKTADGNKSTSIAANAGTVAVNKTPFVWSPSAPAAAGLPCCLILGVGDSTHPVLTPSNDVKTKDDFDKWISGQSNMAYKKFVAPPAPVLDTAFVWEGRLNIGNDKEQEVSLSLTCLKHDPNAEIDFVLDKNDVNGNIISIGKRHLDGLNEVYSATAKVAADFASLVSVKYYVPASQRNSVNIAFTLQASISKGDGFIEQQEVIKTYTVSINQTEV